MTRTMLITGATGTIGTALIESLTSTRAGHDRVQLRALLRQGQTTTATAGALRARGIESVIGDLDTPESLAPAFDGVDDLFLLTPNSPRAPENNMNALWAARQAGTERVVRLSAIGAAPDAPTRSGRLHALSDIETSASGMAWTILKPYWIMQNLLSDAESIARTSTFATDMGKARLAMIDARDIAAVAARILSDTPDTHHAQTYTLTGPAAITFDDVATHATTALGRTITHHAVSYADRASTLIGCGLDPWLAGMLTEYSAAYNNGWGEPLTDTVETLLGRPPIDVSTFLADHSRALRPATAKRTSGGTGEGLCADTA